MSHAALKHHAPVSLATDRAMSRCMSLLLSACLALAPIVCRAADDGADVSYKNAKPLFASGNQSICGSTYLAKPDEKWLALAETLQGWELQKAIVTGDRMIEARNGKATWFFKPSKLPFGVGPVVVAKLNIIKTNDPDRPQITFWFHGKHWRWVNWGGDGNRTFSLTDGISRWALPEQPEADKSLLMQKTRIEVPAAYKRALLQPRTSFADAEYPRTFELEWAGDLNGDGLLDFIVHGSAIEVSEDDLWIGEKSPQGELQFKEIIDNDEGCD